MNTSENQWYVLFPELFFMSHHFPCTETFPALQPKYLERIPRLFVNLSPPLLEQVLGNVFVFSTEGWFPKGFKASGLSRQLCLICQSHTGKEQQIGAFVFI